MKLLTCLALVVTLSLTGVPLAVAQQSAEPVVRIGDWVEVGNEVFMNIIGAITTRYRTTSNWDFDSKQRDRTDNRSISSSVNHEGSADLLMAEIRFGADFRYKKNLTMRVLFEQQNTFDANTIDATGTGSNPGGTDIFGRGTTREEANFHVERYWIDYKFSGTPLRVRVGAWLKSLDLALLTGEDDPGAALYGDFGALDLAVSALIKRESQRIGLTNDNDYIYYDFMAGYDFKPHRVQLNVQYFRDRFTGADTQGGGVGDGFRGQKTDMVGIQLGWKGKVGPVRGLLEGLASLGTARGGTGFGLPPGVRASRDYDIRGFGVIAHVEVDLGMVRPFVGAVYGTGDGDPTDNKLQGYYFQEVPSNTSGLSTNPFRAMELSPGFGGNRGYHCPGRMVGASPRPGGNPNLAIGNDVFDNTSSQCVNRTGTPFNTRVGALSHPGIFTAFSNPGVLAIPVGARIFPVKGHQIAAAYLYKQFISTQLLDIAYNLPSGSIDKAQINEITGYWAWTPNPHLYVRLGGSVGWAAAGYKDLARLATCGNQQCTGDDVALNGELFIRGRF